MSDPGIAAVRVAIDASFKTRGEQTRIKTLRLRNTGGYTIELRCKGRGCPFKRKVALPTTKNAFNVERRFRGAKLRRGAVILIRVVRGELYGKWYRFRVGQRHRLTIDPPKGRPRRVTRRLTTVRGGCLRPSSTKPTRCPRLAGTAASAATTATLRDFHPAPVANKADHTKVVITADESGGTWWNPGGWRYRAYLTTASVRYLARTVGRSESAQILAGGVCGIVGVRTGNPYSVVALIVGCQFGMLIYRKTVQAWLNYVARYDNCLVLYFYPGVNQRSWNASGAWLPVGNPSDLSKGWVKFNLGTVPNEGPGGNCRAH